MKRYLLTIFIFIECIGILGCEKQEDNKKLMGGWENVLDNQDTHMSEDEINIFNKAKADYKDLELEAVAVIGKQVVAGTNYMYLAKGYKKGEEEKTTYKFVVVYKDLKNNASITKVTDFDYQNYVNENKEGNTENLAGGWYSSSPGKPIMLAEKIQTAFDKATETLTGMVYKPIAVIGKQIVSGTNYAILCYGEPSVYPNDSKTNIYVITLYVDLNDNSEIISSSYVALGDYNK